ncbi:dimethylaniline monooxygenase [Colletotrichum sojae]|uniref:Flavin-containing monooxygenase 1 n=1 Tax=Colletotrichum sojae TaxID=2175907 RepID=A0A8H6JPI4_9PEZI|nr:dimethylaniline monooxygenase [Colletotrichum sojae]
MSSQSKRVAIIGAGTSGLTAIKELVAAGIEVQCFESASKLGGQWLYEPNPTPESHSSIYRGLVVNSCRDSSCFSDFPIDPARYPIFYPHDLHLRYIGEWAAHFDLEKHVRFGVSVVGCAPRKEGGWEVRVRSHDEKAEEEEEVLQFDAVICGSGLSRRPKVPEFPGREAFEGEVLHSHFYRTPTPFDGKKVVIVGLGSTAVDLACEIGPLAKELHVVNKRGAWIIPRFLLGKPAEAWNSRSSATWIPFSVQAFLYDKILAHALGPPPAVLKPDHKIMEQNPSVRGDFVEKLQSGVFSLHRANVSSFTASGVALDDGTNIDADVVILCTGYHHADLPYLPPGALAARDAPAPHVDLYKSVVPPRIKDLFVMGQVEVAGPAIPIIEAQARYVTAILTGKLQLPGEEAMMRDIADFRAWQGRHFVNSERHTMTVEYNPYIDGLLAPLGAVPSGWRLLWRVFSSGRPARAFSVYKAVFFEIQIGAQWRLDGEGACRELAEETLIRMASGADRLSDAEKALLGL